MARSVPPDRQPEARASAGTARWRPKRSAGTTKNHKISTGEHSMQVASSAATPSSPAQRNLMAGETSATLAANNDPRLAQYKIIRRNGAVVGFEPSKIAIAVTKAFLAVNGGQGAASARVRELTAQAHRRRRRRADEAQARRRRDPHRGDPGPGRARADARRRARSRARLRALSRKALAGARARKAGKGRQLPKASRST